MSFPVEEDGYEINLNAHGVLRDFKRRFISEEHDINVVYKDVDLVNEVYDGVELEPRRVYRSLGIGEEVYILNPGSEMREERVPRADLPDSIDALLEQRAELDEKELERAEEVRKKALKKRGTITRAEGPLATSRAILSR